MDPVLKAQILGYEKRREERKKYYVYVIKVNYTTGKKGVVYRRYSQFDAFRQTVENLVKDMSPPVELPKLPPKKYLSRSSIHNVAIQRRPILQKFLNTTIAVTGMDTVQQVLSFFLTPTSADQAAAKMAGRRTMEGHLSDDDSDDEEDDLNDSTSSNTPQAKAQTVDEEILMSEEAFYNQLLEVRDNFFPQLRSILTAPEAKTLFSNWAELVTLSSNLNKLLAEGKATGTSTATVLAQQLPTLVEPYTKYCSGIPAAQELYEKKLSNKAFAKFEASFTELNKPTLSNVMRPVQRVMKYPLLLSELKKTAMKASVDAAEQKEIDTALDIATDLAMAANSTMSLPRDSLSAVQISRPQSGSFQHMARGGDISADVVNEAQARCKYRSERVCRHFTIDGSEYCEMHTCEMEDCFSTKPSRQVYCLTCLRLVDEGLKQKSIRRKKSNRTGAGDGNASPDHRRNLYAANDLYAASDDYTTPGTSSSLYVDLYVDTPALTKAPPPPPPLSQTSKPSLVPMASLNGATKPPPSPSPSIKEATIRTIRPEVRTKSPPPPVTPPTPAWRPSSPSISRLSSTKKYPPPPPKANTTTTTPTPTSTSTPAPRQSILEKKKPPPGRSAPKLSFSRGTKPPAPPKPAELEGLVKKLSTSNLETSVNEEDSDLNVASRARLSSRATADLIEGNQMLLTLREKSQGTVSATKQMFMKSNNIPSEPATSFLPKK